MNRPSVVFLEKLATVLVIMAFGGSVLPVMLTSGKAVPVEAESSGVMILFAGIYVVILALVMSRPWVAARIATISPLLSALVLLTFVSALWSLFPDVTLRRALALLFTTVFGVYLAVRWPMEETVAMLVTALGLLVLLSFVFVAALPEVGIDQNIHRGAWKGVFFQKNVTGRMMVWLILGLLWLGWIGYGPRLLRWGMLALAVVLLVMCRSGTGLLASGLVFGVMVAARLLRGEARALVPVVAGAAFAVVVIGVSAATNYKDVLFMLGRDATLTGRTELWAHTWYMLQDQFVLGYGFGAYWYDAFGPASVFIHDWGINQAHNGWLELLLDVGLPGLVLMLLLVGRLILGSLALARYGGERGAREAAWILAVTCGVLAISMSESVFLERHSLNWVVLTIALVRVALLRRPAWTARPATPAPAVNHCAGIAT
ncbi:MAG TPA: O-antigen ligase family protein [Azospirillum sp.]